ncbi:MAG: tetrathionate reductase family octaheme c-type cytochrome [Candidatus Krumholzibacteriia bacterium]
MSPVHRVCSRAVSLLPFALALALPALAGAAVEEHQMLEGPFASGPEVTEACLMCHEDAAFNFMKSSHWTWESLQNFPGRGEVQYGKKTALNNFCIGLPGNWPRCTSCHAGYGWEDASFDFADPQKVDCLVCHDTTGQYRKFPTGAGHPVYEPREWEGEIWQPVDLAMVARSVGAPSRENCGACHFFGGGGNAVKHGDLDTSLLEPRRTYDVHMGVDGADMTCQECHQTENHLISGNALVASPTGFNHLECTDCHDLDVHDKKVLNWHVQTVACQACHIPSFAKERPTKVWWDWSTAGEDRPVEEDEYGLKTYDKKKGTFRWEKDIVPTYSWYNGSAGVHHLGDRMSPEAVTRLNWPNGSKQDLKARIYPFKEHRGKQPYDSQRNVFINPKLFGQGGYWKTFDWKSASAAGMQAAGLEFSGEVDFAETVMYWKVNHMVVPADQALQCNDCHARDGSGRLDWASLGYKRDPMRERGLSRFSLGTVYGD